MERAYPINMIMSLGTAVESFSVGQMGIPHHKEGT